MSALWKIERNSDKEGNRVIFFGHACVFECVKEREQSLCGGLMNTEGGRACISCVCMCASSSARAVSLILHAHREWRMTGEYTAGGGHVMLIAIFTPQFIFF